MLDALQTVFGAVATKDIVPILTHILIYEGRMQAADGCVTIDCPFPNKIKPCAVPGQKLLQAVKACNDAPDLSITEGGKLAVKKGKFRALLSVLPKEDFPLTVPEGELLPVPSNFVKVLTALRPFVSKDASRPWSMGIQFAQGYAYATNNISLVRMATDWNGPPAIIPVRAVDDLITMRETPEEMRVSERAVTFFYHDDSWLKSQFVDSQWPDVAAMLDNVPLAETTVPPTLLDDVTKVHKFCTNQKFPQVFFGDEVKSDEGEDQAVVEGYDLPKSVWHADQIELVLSHAQKIDFSRYPLPCSFVGQEGLHGIFVGVKA